MYHMTKALFLFLLRLAFICGQSSSPCRQDDKPYRFFSTRTSYDVARSHDNKPEHVKGCTARQLYMLIRHGTRFPGPDEIENIQIYLPSVRDIIVKNQTQDILCSDTISNLQKWKLKMKMEEALEITETGLKEMYEIGQRMHNRFPDLIGAAQQDMSKLDLRYSENYRNALSAKYFAMGLLDKDIDQQKQFTEDVGYSVPIMEDKLLLFTDLCQKYIRQRLQERDTEKVESVKFNEGEHMQTVLADMEHHLSLGPTQAWNLTLLNTVIEACRFEFAIYGESTWCDVLTLDAIQALEYRQDMKYYWRYGHGRDVNYQPACLLVEDLLTHFKDATKDNFHQPEHNVVLRFGHSRTILPFLVRLGLFNESKSLQADTYAFHRDRQWQLGKINPFSSNIAFALYDCGGEPKVRTFLNEHIIQLPGCDTKNELCNLEVITGLWQPIVDNCMFNEICESDGQLDLSDLQRDLHHL